MTDKIQSFARALLLVTAMMAVGATNVWAQKTVWQDTDATQTDTYLNDRRALVGRHCVANKLINVAGVGSWNQDMNNITDEDLSNFAEFPKVIDATVAVNPVVSVRDMNNHYTSGMEAGFVLQSNSSYLLNLDIIKTFAISFYLEGELVGTSAVSTGQDVTVLGLSLLTIPGSDENTLEVTANAPGEFDEIALMPAGGVDAAVATSIKIRYAFVGAQRKNTVTQTAMAEYAQRHGRRPFTLDQSPSTIGSRLVDDDLTNIGAYSGVLGIGASFTAKATAQFDRNDPDNSQVFKKGSIVGFNYSQASLLDLSTAPVVTITLYKGEWVEKTSSFGTTSYEWEETEVQTETVNGTVLGLNLIKGGTQNATIIATEDFSAMRITMYCAVELDLGGTAAYYAFVCDNPEAAHECDIKLSADVNICDSESSYQVVNDGTVDVTWSIEGQPSGAAATVSETGLVTGMTVNGDYVVRGTSVNDGQCLQEVLITRGLAGAEAMCDSPIYNSGIQGDDTFQLSEGLTDNDGGVLISVGHEIINAENILNPQTADFATYRPGGALAENLGIIGVRKTNGTISDGVNDHTVGFVVESRSTGLDLTAINAFSIRAYRNGVEVYSEAVDEFNVIGLGLIGNMKNQKMRLAVTIPASVEFDEFALWKAGVLEVEISTMKIYYAFNETVTDDPATTTCLDPLGCDSQLVSPQTTGATLNGNQTRNIGVINVANVIDNLSFLIDNDITSAVMIAKTVSLGNGLVIAVDLGRTYTASQQIGIIIDKDSYLASLNVANWLTFETFKDGVATGDKQTDWKTAGVNVIGFGDKTYLKMHPTADYDEVRITIAGVLGALDFTKLYGLFVTNDRDADGIADCRDTDSCADELVLNEDATVLNKSKEAYTGANLVLHRTLYNEVWNPIVLPVNVTGLQLRNAFGNNMKVAAPKALTVVSQDRQYGGSTYGTVTNCIEFEEVTDDMDNEYVIRKGQFYLIMPDADILPDLDQTQTYTALDQNEGVINGPIYFIPGIDYVNSDLDINELSLTTSGAAQAAPGRRAAPADEQEVVLNGTYVNMDGDVNGLVPQDSYAYRNDGSLWEVGDSDSEREMKGFRFYIENNTNNGNVITYGFDEGSGVVITGIIGVRDDALKPTADPNVYTIDGRTLGRLANLNELPAGIYIVNGKKVLVK